VKNLIIATLTAIITVLSTVIAKLTVNLIDVELEPVSDTRVVFSFDTLDAVIVARIAEWTIDTSVEVVEVTEIQVDNLDFSNIIAALGLATPVEVVASVVAPVIETAVSYVVNNPNGKFVYIVDGRRAEVTANVPASWTWFSARIDIVEHYTNNGVLTGKMAVLAGGMSQDTFERMVEWNQYSDAVDNRSTIKFI